jgi:PAS domain S-box-containing protein
MAIAQLVVLVAATGILLGAAPSVFLWFLLAAVLGSTGAAVALWRFGRPRIGIAVVALAWGVGVGVAIPHLGAPDAALLLLMLGALVVGAAATSSGDAWAFRLSIAGLLGPALAGLFVRGQGRFEIDAACVVVAFVAVTSLVGRRPLSPVPVRGPRGLRDRGRPGREFVEALFTSVPNAIGVVDQTGAFVAVNPEFVTLFGFTEHEVLGRPLINLLVPESGREAAHELEQRVRAGETVVTEAERRRKDGAIVTVRISVMPTRADGQPAALFLYTDITSIRRVEAERREVQQRLEQVISSSTAVIYASTVFGDTFTPTWVSENLVRVTGHGAGEALDPAWWLDHLHPDDQTRVFAELPALFAADHLATEYRFRHADGRYRWIHDESRLVRDAAGIPVEVTGAWLDITDRRMAEEAMREAKDLAERLARTRAAFLANMSHEIRTPLNAVLGLTELVLDTDLSAYQRRSLDMVRAAGETLLSLLNDVLDFSKMEAEHLTLECIRFDLRYLLESTAGLLAVRVNDRPIELLSDIAATMPHLVRGDPTRLRQVLTNLIGNAIKFTQEGEVVVSATAEAMADGQCRIRFAVRDTGIGIPADQIGSIFEEFTQADASMTRKYGGTGLGLSIAKRLVTLMGGELTVASQPGRGSQFAFTLVMPVEEQRPAVSTSSTRLGGQRMLIIDDNTTNRRIVREMLQPAGVAVDEAPGANDGLAALRQAVRDGRPYALAVIDAQMPGRDGFQLATDVRADIDLAGTRLLMLTSAGQRGDQQRCRDTGIEGYLTKPATRADLLEMIAALLPGDDGPAAHAELLTRHSIAESRRRLYILIAEDNPVNQEVAATMLRKRGHRVDGVANGREAVAAVARVPYDLVLMDIQMPEMDGFEATERIRAGSARADVPIIALTAHALTGERERCLANGMTGYLSKPFRAHDLFAVVEGAGGPSDTEFPEGPEVAPAVDIDAFRRTMREAGAEDAVDAILDLFVQTAPERVAALTAAMESGDAKAIATASHAFKSPSGAIGARRLGGLLQEMELAGKAGDVVRARCAFADVGSETEAVLEQLRLLRTR